MAIMSDLEKRTFCRMKVMRPRLVCGLILFCILACARSACAQRNAPMKDTMEPADDLQRLPSDRKIVQQLQDLTRQARAGNLSKIRDLLHVLQAAEPSLMVPDGTQIFRPLHRDLIERIQAFPTELQMEILKDISATTPLLETTYELEGPAAVVRFLHQHSGSAESYKAHLLLAAIHRDRGHRQAMMYWLSPVLHSAAPAELRKIAATMQNELKYGSKVESSREQTKSEDSTIDRPDTANAAVSTVSPFPLAQAWQQKLQLSLLQRRASSGLVRDLAADGNFPAIAWVAGEPVVDAQAVYVRSSGGLLAYDRMTGRALWTRLFDRQTDVRRATDVRRVIPDDNDRAALDAANLQNSSVITELHRDEVTTRMTSDTSRLFAICDTGESAASPLEFSEPFRRLQRRGDLISSSLRELVAIEKSTGRRLWSVGGSPLEAQFGNELSRAWFAGPPTVSGNTLFGLIERDDAHWLVCLRSETGEVLWKLMLAYPETDIFLDVSRQQTASRPLIAEGLIWTKTSDGWLIAVDALTRSMIWSRSMIQKQSGMPGSRNFRGNLFSFQALPPFRECWRPESMMLMPDSLLVTGPEGHQMQMINPLTGSARRRISPEAATLILAVDDESIVVAGPKRIQRLRRDNFDVVWATRLTKPGLVPIGPGARRDNHLLVPLSDGSVQIVRYSDGQLTDNIPGLRPEFSAGGLKNIGDDADDIVSYGPDHVALLSRSGAVERPEPDLIEQARTLITAGQFADAEKTLAGFTPTAELADATHKLLFRIATALTLNDTDHRETHLQNAARYASTTQDKAVVQFLTFESQPEMTPDRIVSFLNIVPAVLQCELPESEELKLLLASPLPDNPIEGSRSEADRATENSRVMRPLQHVFLQVFEQRLAETKLASLPSWIAALSQISDADLLSIGLCNAAVRDELLRRASDAIAANRVTESTLHLLLQARHCENQIRVTEAAQSASETSADRFDERFTDLIDQFSNRLTADAARGDLPLRPNPAALNLLAVMKAELLPASVLPDSLDPQRVLSERWSALKDQTYSMIPVNPVAGNMSSQWLEQKLFPSGREDRFLSAWQWSTFLEPSVQEPSVLVGRSLLQPTESLCTIDGGMFDSLSSGSEGTIVRAGSVLLVQNASGLTAVSLIDQRVLWSRQIPNYSSGAMRQSMPDKRLFQSFSTSLPVWQDIFGSDLRICGGSDRWICVQSLTRVEVMDLLTGKNLWSLQTSPGQQNVFATESCVFLNDRLDPSDQTNQTDLSGNHAETVTCLNRIDGTVRQTDFSRSQLQQTILATADELVVWEAQRPGSTVAALNWINAVTGDVRFSLPLTNLLNCQFMDTKTLVCVTSDATFEVIDLLTAEKQVVQYAAHVNDDEEAIEKPKTPDPIPKVVILADSMNYYVLPIPDRRADEAQVTPNLMSERHLYPVEKQVQAIDRATGKLRWVRDVAEKTAVWFEPTSDPVLLLINLTASRRNAQDDYRATVTGLSKVSGTKLFDHSVQFRFQRIPLEFKITPQQYLDLQAFGNRVRFVPESAPIAVP